MADLPQDLAVALASVAEPAGAFATRILFRPVVASTNDEAAALAVDGAPEGTTVLAEEQTAGRGRRGRTWHSPAGAGIYFSTVFRPTGTEILTRHGSGSATALLTVMSGVAVAEGIRQATGLDVAIKWPNDIVVETGVSVAGQSRRRKLAGILAEAAVTGDLLQHVIVGIGINLREVRRPPEIARHATSIERELGRACERGPLVATIVATLAQWRRWTLAGDLQAVLQRWRELSPSSRGARVEWEAQGSLRRGVTAGIDRTGALLIDMSEGRERVVAGELSWE
jgi:BirA family biotin operon repressor/biotin-[acetyl-CoA-carboxylase] ligase